MPLFWASLAFLGGIVFASQVALPIALWLALAISLAVAALVTRLVAQKFALQLVVFSPQKLYVVLLALIAFSFGAARYEYSRPVVDASTIAYYNDIPRKAYVTGILIQPPDVRDTYENLRVDVEAIDTGQGDVPVHGTLLVRLNDIVDLQYGQRIRVRDYVKTPPSDEEFSYRDYLALQGIHSYMRTYTVTVLPGTRANPFWQTLYRLQTSLYKRIYTLFPDPEASLLAGILLGLDNNIPADIQQAFRNTGTAHIIAISGFNITIIAALLVMLFSHFFGKRLGSLVAVVGIIGYTLLVGANPSVVRAAIMGTLAILAEELGRRNAALNMLAFVGMIMAAIDPFVLWDIGFQLSFAATLGLVLYAGPLQTAAESILKRYLPEPVVQKAVGPVTEYFLLTLAAQVAILPLTAYYFGQVSLISFLANPFVLPAQPPLMVLSGLAVLLSHVSLPLGKLIAVLAWPFAAYTIRMVEFFNGFPNGVLALGSFNLFYVFLFYALLIGLTLAGSRLMALRAKVAPGFGLVFLAVLSVIVWRSALSGPDGRLHVTFLDVGSGDAVLIKTPQGHFVLIDGGPSPSELADQIGRRLPPFNRQIDYLVIASTQENEVAALPRLLQNDHPTNVLWSGNIQASFSSEQVNTQLKQQHIPVKMVQAGDDLDLSEGARLRVLGVTTRGAVLLVEWQKFRVLLPFGIDFDLLSSFQQGKTIGSVTALSLADNGYAPSNPSDWLANLDPQLFILSVAPSDPNGLPDPALIQSLAGTNLLRTDTNGWVDLSSDGQKMWITVQHK